MITYPSDRLLEEAAFIAYYFHWPHDEIMALPHRDRQTWCRQISAIHKEVGDMPKNVFDL